MSNARKLGLPRAARLRKTREFERAYREGKRVVARYFVAFVALRSEGPLRLGVVASRRVGDSVARNRAKRLLREAFRRGRPKREVSADVVLVARAPIANVGMREVESGFDRRLRKLLEKIP